ncbi:MAG: LicD family protein [Bacteroidales bacterium]|nr:LicD family protein [Bacteroidales bacterium]
MEPTKEVQKRILEIFRQVEKICEKNDIRYYAIAGTCLGAVRHQGFIPWDDDLDIAMPLEDFKRFLAIFEEEKPDYLELFSMSLARHDYQFFVKVMDNRTMMTEDDFCRWKDTYEGVWIDIFPMSGSPAPGDERSKFVKRASNYIELSRKVKKEFSSQESGRSKLLWILVCPFRLFPKDFFWKRWIRLLEKYPFDSSPYVSQVWDKRTVELILPREWYADYVYFDFEDSKIRCPEGYDAYLTMAYGDYMEYPPEDQRNSGHYFDKGAIDLEHSFKDYQSGKYRIG